MFVRRIATPRNANQIQRNFVRFFADPRPSNPGGAGAAAAGSKSGYGSTGAPAQGSGKVDDSVGSTSSFSGYGNNSTEPTTASTGKDAGYSASSSSANNHSGSSKTGKTSDEYSRMGGGGSGAMMKTSWSNYALIAGIIGAPLMYFYYTKNRRHGLAKEAEQTANRIAPIESKIDTKDIPGNSKSIKTLGGEATASAIQNFDPTKGFNTSVCEILFPGGDMKRPIKAYRYIRYLNDDTAQSVIYDGDSKDSRLIGVEFHITEKLYNKLPSDEKRLWHSHAYEVKTGALTAPRLPEAAEREFMKQLAYTYGKAWSFWETDKGDSLPLGVPQLMVSATDHGQLPSSCISAEKMKSRQDLAYPSNIPKASESIKLRIA